MLKFSFLTVGTVSLGPPGPVPSLASLQGRSVEEAPAGGVSPCSPWGQIGRPGAAWAPEGRALTYLSPESLVPSQEDAFA